MFEVLNSYLFQHKSISIPGLGTIYVEILPASIDIGNKNILPPVHRFRFDKYFDAPDKEFFSYLATQKKIPEYEAIKWYNEFSSNLRDKILHEEKVKWEGVGVLKKDYAGNLVFESSEENPFFLRPAPASLVTLRHSQHSLLVGDRETTNLEAGHLLYSEAGAIHPEKQTWWIYALVIGIIALIILSFHFSSNGWQAGSFKNQQMLVPAK